MGSPEGRWQKWTFPGGRGRGGLCAAGTMNRPWSGRRDRRRRAAHSRTRLNYLGLLLGAPLPFDPGCRNRHDRGFRPHSVCSISRDQEDPEIAFWRALRIECAPRWRHSPDQRKYRSGRCSPVTDHYLQIIANARDRLRAEFVNQRGHNTSTGAFDALSVGRQPDRLHLTGSSNWKEIADRETASEIAGEVGRAISRAPATAARGADCPVGRTPQCDYVRGRGRRRDGRGGRGGRGRPAAGRSTLSLWPDRTASPTGFFARATSAEQRPADSAAARALPRARLRLRFALAAEDAPRSYASSRRCRHQGAGAHAPMTRSSSSSSAPRYDKTRLTESAPLVWAKREGVACGALAEAIESHQAASRPWSPPSAPTAPGRKAQTAGPKSAPPQSAPPLAQSTSSPQ